MQRASMKTDFTFKAMVCVYIVTLFSAINAGLYWGSVNTARAWADAPAAGFGNQAEIQISPLSADFINYFDKQRLGRSPSTEKSANSEILTGYIPSPLPAEKHHPESAARLKALSTGDSIEPRYDMRDPNTDGNRADSFLTPVKKQYAGNCWAYATYGSLESQLKQYGIDQDFSEDRLTTDHGFDWSGYDGGNIDMSAAYLARHDGPTAIAGVQPLRYVDNIVFLPVRSSVYDNRYIKAAIKKYGGLVTYLLWSNGSYDARSYTYYYDDPDDSYNDVNHAVVIVGWDDQKKVSGAPGPGAFIVRNSWGAQWAEGGYLRVLF